MAKPEAEAHVVVETVAKCMFLVVGVGGGLSRRWLRFLDGSCSCWMDWMDWLGACRRERGANPSVPLSDTQHILPSLSTATAATPH